MKSNRKTKTLILIILGIFFAFIPIFTKNLRFTAEDRDITSNYNDEFDHENLKFSAISGPIYINDTNPSFNWSVAKEAGICTGNGTYSEPYIIEDLVIDGGGSGSCIVIENSDVYFKIENCTVYNSGEYWSDAGIKLELVSNGVLFNNTVNNNNRRYGIKLHESYNNTISGNTANNNRYGITIVGSNNNISGNTVNNNEYGIFIRRNDNSISGNTANNNDKWGIYVIGSNYNVSDNIMNDCGLKISGGFEELCSHEIDITNLVNDKPLYYYTNELNLGTNNFTNAGQVILVNCSDSLISNLNVSYGGGISLHYCKKNTLSNNTANNNDWVGIALSDSDNNTVLGNTANNNEYGITIVGSNNNISGNIANDNDYDGILIHGNDSNIVENTANNNEYGITIVGSNNNLSGNTANNNYRDGIELSSCHYNNLSGNTANSNRLSGIALWGCDNNIVSGNTANNNEGFGIALWGCDNNIVSGNIVNYNYDDGIYFYYCDNNSLLVNNVSYNNNGVYLYRCDGNLISGNIINNNSIGIYLIKSTYNYVVKNSFRDNSMDIVEENCEGNYFGYINNIYPFEIVILIILIPIIIITITTGILKLTKRYVKHQSERGRL